MRLIKEWRAGFAGAAALAAAAIIVSGAAPAEAGTYIITYEGTVVNSTDTTGVFGGSGSSLDELPFTAVYTLTAPVPGAYTYDTGTLALTAGGSLYGGLPSPVSATLKINGVTQSVAGDRLGYAEGVNGFGASSGGYYYDGISLFSEDQIGNDFTAFVGNNILSYANDFLATQDYKKPFSYTVRPGDIPTGSFYWFGYTNDVISITAYGSLEPTSVTVAPATTPAVPEPATWAMMIVGFGMVGGAMRRRARAVAFH